MNKVSTDWLMDTPTCPDCHKQDSDWMIGNEKDNDLWDVKCKVCGKIYITRMYLMPKFCCGEKVNESEAT